MMSMFSIDAGERSSGRTLTSIVVGRIRKLISSGALRTGERLPSREVLASKFGVSEFVVRRALAELSADRLIAGRPRIGHVVLRRGAMPKERLVIDVSTENFGSYASRVSTAESFRALSKRGYRVVPVTLGVDARETAYLAPLADAMKSTPDFVFVRTCGSRQSLVCRMVADGGVPFATVTLGTALRNSSRCIGTIRLEKDAAIRAMVQDCVKCHVRSALQVDFAKDTYVDASSDLRARGIFVERLSIPLVKCLDLDDVVETARLAVEQRIASGTMPDIIFVADDYLSLGVIAALRRRRVEPPRDVRLVVYANRGSGLFAGDEYARIELDPFADGREIARCIADYFSTGTFGRYANPLAYRRGKSFGL